MLFGGLDKAPAVEFSRVLRRPHDRDEGLEDTCAAALGALAWFRQPARVEDEATPLASRRFDTHIVSSRAGGPDRVPQVFFHVLAAKPEFAGERRDGSWLLEHLAQLSTQRHRFI